KLFKKGIVVFQRNSVKDLIILAKQYVSLCRVRNLATKKCLEVIICVFLAARTKDHEYCEYGQYNRFYAVHDNRYSCQKYSLKPILPVNSALINSNGHLRGCIGLISRLYFLLLQKNL